MITTESPKDYRARLLAGFEASAIARGYAATTIAGIVRHARVSKRTFYEHFPDKEACFLASYEARTGEVLRAIADAQDARLAWREQIRTSVKVYLEGLQARPPLTQMYLLEFQAVGARAVELRRAVMARFDATIRDQVSAMRRRAPGLRELSAGMATAIVGGIEALVLYATGSGRGDRLTELEDEATAFMCAVVQGNEAPSAAPRAGAGAGRRT